MCPIHSVALINLGVRACTSGPPAPQFEKQGAVHTSFFLLHLPSLSSSFFSLWCLFFSPLSVPGTLLCCLPVLVVFRDEERCCWARPGLPFLFSLIPSCWALRAKHDAVPWACHDELTRVLPSPSFQRGERATNS